MIWQEVYGKELHRIEMCIRDRVQKSDIVNYFSGNNMIILTIAFFITDFIYFFMFNMIMVMMYALFLGIAGYLTAVALRLRLKISAMIKMAVYALTLPTILLTIYTVYYTHLDVYKRQRVYL